MENDGMIEIPQENELKSKTFLMTSLFLSSCSTSIFLSSERSKKIMLKRSDSFLWSLKWKKDVLESNSSEIVLLYLRTVEYCKLRAKNC